MRRRYLAVEVIQTSLMDCGPASLKCLLEGFGLSVSYGRLREACQTDVDGSSIDTLEVVANDLGLEADQIMVPADHVLLPEAGALPALAVLRLPSGLTHFVVLWRRHGPWVQVMDPASGRRWMRAADLAAQLYCHRMPVSAADWREWAGTEDFVAPLRARMHRLGIRDEALLEGALAAPASRPLAALDAALRMTATLARTGAIAPGAETHRTLVVLARQAEEGPEVIPEGDWSARPLRGEEGQAPEVLLSGAVLLRVKGRRPDCSAELGPELQAALDERPPRPLQELLEPLRGTRTGVALMLPALALAAMGVALEALIFRALIGVGAELGLVWQRAGTLGAVLALLTLVGALEFPLMTGLQRLGRQLEIRLRLAFLSKIPRLGDRYFQSRPISDMAERAHSLHRLRLLPEVGGQLLRAACELSATAGALLLLYPEAAAGVIGLALVAVGLPLAIQPLLAERDLELRTHVGTLSRNLLDALLGLEAIRAHRAEGNVRREHSNQLAQWVRAGLRFQRTVALAESAQGLVGFALAAVLVLLHARHHEASGLLLLAYWCVGVVLQGQEIGVVARQVPSHRNVALRLSEPLGALEEPRGDPAPMKGQGGVGLAFEGLTVRAAGHTILSELELAIAPGSHVAIVGPSGAGKSSLVGVLLGWHRPAEGRILVDGLPLEAGVLDALRRTTAWLEPGVMLWNRSLLDNVTYGSSAERLEPVLEGADLMELLARMPEGLQTAVGEGGGLLSGGEGQRLRFGRALARGDVRLAILDEPFRGLDRATRRRLLAAARSHWKAATLFCVTHDVGATLDFDRVLVVEDGRVVEDGSPSALAESAGSRFKALVEAEEAVRTGLWSSHQWRRIRLAAGRLEVEHRIPRAPGVEAPHHA